MKNSRKLLFILIGLHRDRVKIFHANISTNFVLKTENGFPQIAFFINLNFNLRIFQPFAIEYIHI